MFGKKPGRTALFALDAAGSLVASWSVQVTPEQGTLAGHARAEAATAPCRWTRRPMAAASALSAALAADANVDVREDSTLGAGECVLLHPGGRTELGPLQQFRALMAASTAMDAAR